jgi:hypothetical protein
VEKFNGQVPAVVSSPRSTKCEPAWLADKIKLLFSSYRVDHYPEPELFMAQVGTVLEQYDASVVAMVTSPLTGIQRKCKFPPTIAELVEECNAIRNDMAEASRVRHEPERRAVRVEHPPMRPGEDYDAMFAKYGRPIGFFE